MNYNKNNHGSFLTFYERKKKKKKSITKDKGGIKIFKTKEIENVI